MNILLITHEFPNVGGGVGRSVFSLANDYLQNGHKVILFTCKYSNYKIVGINGLKVISVKGFRRNELENYSLHHPNHRPGSNILLHSINEN